MSKMHKLESILLSLGGRRVALRDEPDIDKILSRGKTFAARGSMFRPMQARSCHSNAAELWEKGRGRVQIVTGWALSPDGIWRQHSWGLEDGRVIETTERRTAYFGVALTPRESKRFSSENFFNANRPGGGHGWGRGRDFERNGTSWAWLLPVAVAGFVTAVLGYLAGGAGGKGPPPLVGTPVSWLNPGSRVLLIGSSSALGLQAPFTALCKGIGAEVVTRGKNGSTAVGWSSTIASEVAAARPDTVVVVLGGNDSATTYPPERHSAAIQTFVDAAAAQGANLYWVLPFTLPWLDKFSPLVRAAGIRVFETPKAGIPMAADRIHATPVGYKILAEKVFEDLA